MAASFQDDPCGWICVFLTYLAVFYADYVIVQHLVLPAFADSLWGTFHVIVFNWIVFMITASHLKAMFVDPGKVPLVHDQLDFTDSRKRPRDPEMEAKGWSLCTKCEQYRPPRAYHCRICRRCVRRMDHHCPWVNNCVGEENQKFFIQFLFYVGLASVYAIFVVILSWAVDHKGISGKGDGSKHSKLIHSIILVIECILFGLFVMAIGCDQFDSIMKDQTAVEYVKKQAPRSGNRTTKQLCQEVFGQGAVYTWLWPFSYRLKRDSLDRLVV